MQPFTTLRGIAAAFLRSDVDTDAIIPSPWLRQPDQDLAEGLFAAWRRDAAGQPRPDFPLNVPRCRGASVLLAGANFGCGSSREAAVWALLDFGIRCVVAPSFADIFYENACHNGLLPAILSEGEVKALAANLAPLAEPLLTVDLAAQRITTEGGQSLAFAIAKPRRAALLAGADAIAASLKHRADILAFQARDREERPWIYRAAAAAKEPQT